MRRTRIGRQAFLTLPAGSVVHCPRARTEEEPLTACRLPGVPQWRDAREIVFQDEPGSEPPITHVFFLPSDDNLGPAPFPVAGQSDPSDEVQAAGAEEEGEVGAGSSSAQRKTQLADWRQRRSVSRVRSGKRTVYVVRLVSPRAGFGRRRCLGRCLASAVAEQEEGASGDTNPAHSGYNRECQRRCREESPQQDGVPTADQGHA